MKKTLLAGVAALLLATGTAYAQSGYRPNYDPKAHEWQSPETGYDEPVYGPSWEGCTRAHVNTLSKKPLTPKQTREYKALIGIGITKKDAARVARDPGVKKGEWGWVCDDDKTAICVRGEVAIREGARKYKNNVVCE
jgi:hypothetical protein